MKVHLYYLDDDFNIKMFGESGYIRDNWFILEGDRYNLDYVTFGNHMVVRRYGLELYSSIDVMLYDRYAQYRNLKLYTRKMCRRGIDRKETYIFWSNRLKQFNEKHIKKIEI